MHEGLWGARGEEDLTRVGRRRPRLRLGVGGEIRKNGLEIWLAMRRGAGEGWGCGGGVRLHCPSFSMLRWGPPRWLWPLRPQQEMVPTTDWPMLERDTLCVAAPGPPAAASTIPSWGGVRIPGSASGRQPPFTPQAQLLSSPVDARLVLCGTSFRHTLVCTRLVVCPRI